MAVQIRLAQRADANAIQAIYAPIVVHTAISFELEVPSLPEMQTRIETTTAQYPWLVFEEDAQVAGYAYASPHRTRAAYQWSVDVSAYVHENYRQRGIARTLYAALFKMLQLQGYYNAYAGIALPNAASVRLHEALGFQPIGVYQAVGFKLGAWHDVGWWHLPIQKPLTPPASPQSIQKLFASDQWASLVSIG